MKPTITLKTVLTTAILLASNMTYAQVVGNDVFLQGNHVEVGIGGLGYYGSDSSAPAGYHPHCPSCWLTSSLGFVADPSLAGWDTTTVSPTHYWGDYFVPGNPYEGWALEIGSHLCSSFNSGAGTTFGYSGVMPLCTGGNTGYISTGSQVKATWQGLIDSIILTQITTLDTGSLYFTTQIILTNIASTPANDIYYLRTLDPDNEESWTGNFATINTITHQAVDTTVVTATGPSSPLSYMALGTTFDSATAFIGHNR